MNTTMVLIIGLCMVVNLAAFASCIKAAIEESKLFSGMPLIYLLMALMNLALFFVNLFCFIYRLTH